jgi:hypothetical protein
MFKRLEAVRAGRCRGHNLAHGDDSPDLWKRTGNVVRAGAVIGRRVAVPD